MHLLQVKLFQASQRNVLENLPKQVSFISNGVEQFFKLEEASARTQNSKASDMNEKVQNWANLTQQLIKTIFGELYASRIVNLVSKV